MVNGENLVRDFKVKILPSKGQPNSKYYVPNGNGTDIDMYITDINGNYHKLNPINQSLSYEEVNEELVGVINNINNVFSTTENFYPETTTVFVNGIKQKKPIHYNTTGNNTVIFSDSPQIGDILEINYVKL